MPRSWDSHLVYLQAAPQFIQILHNPLRIPLKSTSTLSEKDLGSCGQQIWGPFREAETRWHLLRAGGGGPWLCCAAPGTWLMVHKEGLQQRGLRKTWMLESYRTLCCRPGWDFSTWHLEPGRRNSEVRSASFRTSTSGIPEVQVLGSKALHLE